MVTWPINYRSLFFLFLFPSILYTQVLPERNKVLALEEEAKISNANFSKIESQTKKLLSNYYEQFADKKKILYERQEKINLSKNNVRLRTLSKSKEFVIPPFVRESPLLFSLHSTLAKAYAKQEKNLLAIQQYQSAFRYAIVEFLSIEEEKKEKEAKIELIKDTNLKEEKKFLNSLKDISQEEKEKRYKWMNRYFMNEKRLLEEDPQIQEIGKKFQTEWKNYQKLKKESIQAKSDLALARFELARGKSNRVLEAKDKLEELRNTWKEKTDILEEIRNNSYKNYLKKRREKYGEVAYEMAIEIRKKELKTKRTYRKQKKISYLRGRGDKDYKADKTIIVDYKGFRSALEFAHKLDPLRLDFIRLLSDENWYVRKSKLSIYFTKLYIEKGSVIDANEEIKKTLPKYGLRLANLYMGEKEYNKAIKNYEEVENLGVKITGENLRQLADLYFLHSAFPDKANEKYEEYLKEVNTILENKDISDDKKSRYLSFQYQSLVNLSSLSSSASSVKDNESEKKYLWEAQKKFKEIESLEKIKKKEWEEKKEELENIRKKLLNKKDEDWQREYFFLKDRVLVEKKLNYDRIKNLRLRINYAKLLERLASLAFHEQNYELAQELILDIIKHGSTQQTKKARKNLRKIQIILNTALE